VFDEKNGKIIPRKQLLGIPPISSTERQKAVVFVTKPPLSRAYNY